MHLDRQSWKYIAMMAPVSLAAIVLFWTVLQGLANPWNPLLVGTALVGTAIVLWAFVNLVVSLNKIDREFYAKYPNKK